ncbi:enoyl-CoA hydratase/isomerase family protein [Aeromicrobium sp. YIM 150415]|uniref:enoyl-CoA hydratase/isomerase family protein n=1 Tax=Aeromicrobium sp. YIM 150415 TaxID=2803912 RepID=UPI0019643E9F|nr:enoyl-CoA hydratase-related protein [Aeromicrobium sp. YIM 150415]MBM9462907.1 enoyl-CoA hydratase/isomerase family protein [Aeromicrobium sp. YIM 150415]
MAEFARLDVAEGIGTLRLDRPKMNALDAQMQREILAAAREADERDDVAAVVLYGGDRVFAAGADIKEMASMDYAQMLTHGQLLQEFTRAVASIGKPTVAAITGFALGGGCEVALAADVRFCAANAKLGQPEILLGIIPGAGGTQRLARLVGPATAKELIYSGRFVDADEALRIGLVDAVHPAEAVYDEAVAWARQFVGGPALALRVAKDVIDRGLEVDLQTGLEIERAGFTGLFATQDQKAGMASFIDNGPGQASFSGR